MPSSLPLFHSGGSCSNSAHAFATQHQQHARIISASASFGQSLLTNNKQFGRHQHLLGMQSDDTSSNCKCQSKRAGKARCNATRKSRSRGHDVISLAAATIASILLTRIKPAHALSASNILSTAKNVLHSTSNTPASLSTYHLTRILFLRLLAIVYTAAFCVAKFQNKGLIGDRGILPARKLLDNAEKRGEVRMKRRQEWLEQSKSYRINNTPTTNATMGSKVYKKCKSTLSESQLVNLFREKFWYRTDQMDRPLPTLLWLASDRTNLNPHLDALANIGLFLSTLMLATGSSNIPFMLTLWIIQRSFMSVGGVFYGYGWEPQLAELTWCALFLVPGVSLNPFFGLAAASGSAVGAEVATGAMLGAYPVPIFVIWAIRWYLFKIMMGAGLIKIKSSDPKWKPGNMSAMDFFYETQVS